MPLGREPVQYPEMGQNVPPRLIFVQILANCDMRPRNRPHEIKPIPSSLLGGPSWRFSCVPIRHPPLSPPYGRPRSAGHRCRPQLQDRPEADANTQARTVSRRIPRINGRQEVAGLTLFMTYRSRTHVRDDSPDRRRASCTRRCHCSLVSVPSGKLSNSCAKQYADDADSDQTMSEPWSEVS
jgi:hypothetical protein